MYSPLIQNMIEKYDYPLVTEASLDDFFQTSEYCVLFFTEDAKSFPESNDVAVVLPELMQAFSNRIKVGVVSRESERPLHARFRFSGYPSLVFFKNGGYLDVISKIHNWSEYTEEVARILDLEVSDPPPFDFSKVCPGSNVA